MPAAVGSRGEGGKMSRPGIRCHYAALRKAGKCVDCYKNANGRARCKTCAKKRADYMKVRYSAKSEPDTFIRKGVKRVATPDRIDKMLELSRQIEDLKRRLHVA